jgi:hypothetical protein
VQLNIQPLGESSMFIRGLLGVLFLVSSSSVFAQDPTGVWVGRWHSETTGHQGPMRARVTPNSDGTYNARFTGRFALVIPFTYRATLTPVACDGCATTLVSSKQLGPIMGTYRMDSVVAGNQFQAGYSAKKDRGTFNMTRRR